MLPLMNLIVLGHEQRPRKSWAVGKSSTNSLTTSMQLNYFEVHIEIHTAIL